MQPGGTIKCPYRRGPRSALALRWRRARRHSAASAQTYGFATLPPGTLNHTTASAIAKVDEGEGRPQHACAADRRRKVIIPLVGRGEAEFGIANIMEAQDALEAGLKDLRLIGAAHALRTPFFVRKDFGMFKIADLKGKRVTMGFSAMRKIDSSRAPCWRAPV